jgi:hypothetical protein
MNLCCRILVYIVICVSFFSCKKIDTPIANAVPDEHPIITEQPKSGTYLENDAIEKLTITVREGYNLSYQWYAMRYAVNYEYTNATEQEILFEVNKLINDNPGDSLFKKMNGQTEQSCSILSQTGQTVYICIVTCTSLDVSIIFTMVSDPAVITLIRHPLKSWNTADKSIFAYNIYVSGNNSFIGLSDIAYGNGYFVAVGNRDYSGGIHSGIIAYSNDGRTWELIKNNPFADYRVSISAVAYGNDRFISVGTNGKIAYSTDIKTWMPVENIVSESFTDIVYGNSCFIASFGSGLVYSHDGETWFLVENFDTSRISCIAFCNGRFIAGTHDGKISFSDDGKTWFTITDNTFDSHEIVTVSYGNGRYLAFARNYNYRGPSSYKMGYSYDGETWGTVTPSNSVDAYWNWIEKIIFGEGYFVAVGGDKTAFSKDGINWDDLGESYQWSYFNHPLDGIYYNAVAYGGGFFVAVSDSGIINYCQWPIAKAIAPTIIQHPRWPSNTSYRSANNSNDRTYFMSVMIGDISFGELSCQWYRNDTDNTTTGIAIEGANLWTYAPDVSKAGTMYYYVKVTNTIPGYFDVEDKNRNVSVTSNTAAVIIDLPEETEIEDEELDK